MKKIIEYKKNEVNSIFIKINRFYKYICKVFILFKINRFFRNIGKILNMKKKIVIISLIILGLIVPLLSMLSSLNAKQKTVSVPVPAFTVNYSKINDTTYNISSVQTGSTSLQVQYGVCQNFENGKCYRKNWQDYVPYQDIDYSSGLDLTNFNITQYDESKTNRIYQRIKTNINKPPYYVYRQANIITGNTQVSMSDSTLPFVYDDGTCENNAVKVSTKCRLKSSFKVKQVKKVSKNRIKIVFNYKTYIKKTLKIKVKGKSKTYKVAIAKNKTSYLLKNSKIIKRLKLKSNKKYTYKFIYNNKTYKKKLKLKK